MSDSNSDLVALLDTKTVPIVCLRNTSKKLLSNGLNQRMILPSEENCLRDWQGLEELMRLSTQFKISRNSLDPTGDLLESWVNQDKESATLNKLLDFLIKMDRWDIIEDAEQLFLEDALSYREKSKVFTPPKPIQFDYGDDILDSYYDACVLYAEEDEDFVVEMIEIMENKYNRKLFVEDRAVKAGANFKHDLLSRVIEERCKHIIVILTPDFYRSQTNQFLANIAQATGIANGVRKLIPCLYKPCEIPVWLKYQYYLKYNDPSKFSNFWEKLNDSIETRNGVTNGTVQRAIASAPAMPNKNESLAVAQINNYRPTQNTLQTPSPVDHSLSSANSMNSLSMTTPSIESKEDSLEKKEIFNSTSILVVKKKGFIKKMIPWLKPKSDIEKEKKKKKKAKAQLVPA